MNTLPTPLATSPLSTWLDYLEQLHSKTIDLGLDRVRRVAQRLGLLTPAPVVYTVAGTNGKGTTCRTLEAILMAAGYRVGVYGSPHLLHYRERVRIQHRELDDAAHAAAFAAVEAGRDGVSLTYFEFGTLAALYLFKQAALDAVILEVGLGGRLDATNIVDPSVAVVTSIALDHTDWLGDTRESIGREKAGIFRGAAPAVVGEPDMPDSIGAVAQACGAHLLRRGVDWDFSVEAQEWRWRDAHRHIEGLPLPQVPLANAATALAALCYGPLPVDDAAIRQGLRDAVLPGRFQQLSEAPRLILDVAHNPHAAAYLAQRLRALPARGRLRMVIGMLSDKDIAGTLACLTPLVDQWYCAPLAGPRGAAVSALTAHLPADAQAFDGVEQAWRQAMADAATDDTVVVCGSFHTVAHVMAALASGETGGK
ncbi:bifunctional tetrahydrofolate synthase/dihydrofolate synthase [Edwardsiella piscicida]|uniref:bifunctional tetrahydrofolate synthase/dihydrofolate synthase n=1 Tax=Edwardsiella piscicida TaxID=1263550 RepID=UPI00370D511E